MTQLTNQRTVLRQQSHHLLNTDQSGPSIVTQLTNQRPVLSPRVAECERPDSGFDSKDDKEEDEQENPSPEVREMCRQAVARQPVVKKKRSVVQK